MAVSLRTALTCIICTCLLIAGTIYISDTHAMVPVFNENGEDPTIVIDPGHGGMDGGAVGVNGVIEKDINLSLSLDLADMFRFAGYQVVLTRTDDRSIHDDGVQGVKKQKHIAGKQQHTRTNP